MIADLWRENLQEIDLLFFPGSYNGNIAKSGACLKQVPQNKMLCYILGKFNIHVLGRSSLRICNSVAVARWRARGTSKGVGPGMTLAWPGWKQSDIALEVDTGRLETSRFKKCCANCVLLYFPSTEFKSAFNVHCHGGGAAGLSCTELSIWEFPFLRGVCWQRWTSI